MMDYKQWRLLNEALGTYPLGLAPRQNIALVNNSSMYNVSSRNDLDQYEEMDMPPAEAGSGMGHPMALPNKKKKVPMDSQNQFSQDDHDEDHDEDNEDDHDEDAEDYDHDEDNEEDHNEDDEEDHDEDDEEDDEEDHDHEEDIDPDKEFDSTDTDSLSGDEDESRNPNKIKFKKPMARVHDNSSFMKYGEAKIMPEKGKEDEPADENLEKCNKMKSGKKKCGSMMKSGKVCPKCKSKNCTCDKNCKKCKGKKCTCESVIDYGRPKTKSNSYREWMKSLIGMYGNPKEKFRSGLAEDLLLPPPASEEPVDSEPSPGDAGYAPQTRIGSLGSNVDDGFSEMADIMRRCESLEKRLKK